MLDLFDDFRIPAVLAINGSAIARYGAIVKAARERRWEFIGHGFSQKNMQKIADERDDIRRTSAAIREATGKNPRGWLGPGLTETWDTPDLLAEEGYDYVCDWVLDDEPTVLKTRAKPIVNIPYTQECNDVAMMLIQHHVASEYSSPPFRGEPLRWCGSQRFSLQMPTRFLSAAVIPALQCVLSLGRLMNTSAWSTEFATL